MALLFLFKQNQHIHSLIDHLKVSTCTYTSISKLTDTTKPSHLINKKTAIQSECLKFEYSKHKASQRTLNRSTKIGSFFGTTQFDQPS